MTNLSGLVFLLLLALKLTGTPIGWFWVFFPLWIGFAVIAGLFLLSALIIVANELVNGR